MLQAVTRVTCSLCPPWAGPSVRMHSSERAPKRSLANRVAVVTGSTAG